MSSTTTVVPKQGCLPGPALSRCGCTGPRTSGGPTPWRLGRLFIFARYSFRTRIV